MAHHHPQLHAHSQLTSIGPGQVHYIQLTSSVLPTTVAYQDGPCPSTTTLVVSSNSKGSYQSAQRSVPQGQVTLGGCVICFGSLPPRISRHHGKPVEIFSKTCELLQISLEEVQDEWNFGHGEKLPFCMACIDALQNLISVQEQVGVLQKKLCDGVESVRTKIRETNNRVSSLDLRTANFRSRALGEGRQYGSATPIPGAPKAEPSIQKSCSVETTANNTVSDFSYIFSQPLTGFQQAGTQNDSSSRQPQATGSSSQLSTYSTLLPVGTTPEASTAFSISHSIFGSTAINADVTDAPNDEEEGSNEGNDYFDEDAGSDEFKSGSGGEGESEDNSEGPRRSPRKKAKRNIPKKRVKSPKATSRSRSSRGRGTAEYFAPVLTDAKGSMTFEGIAITLGKVGYVCGLCGAEVGKSQDAAAMRKIKIHIKGFHLGSYKCTICSKNFTSSDILSQHTVRAHKLQDTPCDICGRPVKPRYLTHHKFTHMNAEEKRLSIVAGFKPQTSSELERKYMCNTCGKMFKKRSVLRRHEQSHNDVTQRKLYRCEICDKGYTTEQALRDHVSVIHDSGNMRKSMCKHCGKVMFPKYLRKHLKTHLAKEHRPHLCKICGRRLVNLKTLQKHEEKHDPKDKPEMYKFECDVCGQRFETFKRMRLHRRKNHQKHWKLAVPTRLINEVTMDKPGVDSFIEDLNNEELQEVDSNICSYQLYEVKKLHDPDGFQCCTCSKEFFGTGDEVEDNVKAHIRSEHIGNFRCNICTKRWKNINEVLAHKRRDHMNKQDMSCSICGRSGLAVGSIKTHEWSHKNPYDMAEAINSGERVPNRYEKCLNQRQAIQLEFGVEFQFQCSPCQAIFSMLDELHKHALRDHPIERGSRSKRGEGMSRGKTRGRKRLYPVGPTDCPICGKTFGTGASMGKHMRKVHKKKGSKYLKNLINPKGYREEDQFKKEVSSACDTECESGEGDNDLHDYYRSGSCSDSDPEFKATSRKLQVMDSPGVSLRSRSSLRPKRNVYYDYDTDDASDVRVRVKRLPLSVESGTVKVKSESVIEYTTPDGELNEVSLIPEANIKRSPQSSGVEDAWDSAGEYNDDE